MYIETVYVILYCVNTHMLQTYMYKMNYQSCYSEFHKIDIHWSNNLPVNAPCGWSMIKLSLPLVHTRSILTSTLDSP